MSNKISTSQLKSLQQELCAQCFLDILYTVSFEAKNDPHFVGLIQMYIYLYTNYQYIKEFLGHIFPN